MRVIASARKRFLLLLCISIGALSIGGGLLFPIGLQDTQRPAAAGQPSAQSEERPVVIFYPNPAEILFMAEQYLSLSIPDFDLYGLASFDYTGGYTGDPGGRYRLSYGVRIGGYLAADRVSFTCTSAGEVLQIELPRTQKYVNLTAQEKAELADKLPSHDEIEQYALEQMQEKYGELFRTMEINDSYIGLESGTCKLYVSLSVRADVGGIPMPYSESVVYPVN